MGCRRYERWLYLYRSGELTREESGELERHLETCVDCKSLKEKIEQAEAHVEKVRGLDPIFEHPDALARKVLEEIHSVKRRPGLAASPNMLDRLLDYFLRPPVRYASAAIVVIAIGSFTFQYFSTLQSVAALERSMASRLGTAVGPVVSYSVRKEKLSALADKSIEKEIEPFRDMVQSNGVIVVEMSTLKSLVRLVDLNASLFFRGRWDRDRVEALVREATKHARTVITFSHEGT